MQMPCITYDHIVISFIVISVSFYYVKAELDEEVYTNCGGVFEKPNGVLHTPMFPGRYPTPIKCEWLIHANPGEKIILYFTQNYMKDSVYVSVYEAYSDSSTYVGRQDFGEITWKNNSDLLSLVAYQPYMLIQFEVDFIGNRQLRFIDHLLDVYGFNVTYEIVDANANVSKETCSVKNCSYLGTCLVSLNYSDFECSCFESFFGDQCQYGPYCDPENNINACYHGGTCRYVFGSLINYCQCIEGFDGAYCEINSSASANADMSVCDALRCDPHWCAVDVEDGLVKCFCMDGYVKDSDGNCVVLERFRYDVSLDLVGYVNADVHDRVDNTTHDEVETELRMSLGGLDTLIRLKIDGFRNTSWNSVLDFSFYCNRSDQNKVEKTISSIVAGKKLGQLLLQNVRPRIEENQELELAAIQNFHTSELERGNMLTLTCAAKGSKNLQFHWYKDFVRLDMSLAQRNAWENVIPPTQHNKMTLSVLNIDVVIPIDQGVFTCEVTDFGESIRKSIMVIVNNYPRMQLDPMSLGVNQGQPISIKCLTPDDSFGKFKYEWFKNGVQIDRNSRREYSEEMFPTGVRLVVPEMQETAVYTCRVTNTAGPANVSAYVFVIKDNETVQFCPREYEGQVMWSNTTGGHFDVKRCPTEQGEESSSYSLNVIDVGYARRHCICDPQTHLCKWGKPNFSKCQSLMLIHTYDELELLRNGYQQTNLSRIFDDLYSFALTEKQDVILYSGDMDMVAGILTNLVSHMKAFPILSLHTKRINPERLVDLIGAILWRSSTATPDEKREIMVGPNVIQTIHTLVTGGIQYLNFTRDMKPFSDITTMQVEYLTKVEKQASDDGAHNGDSTVHSIKKRTSDSSLSKIPVYSMTTAHLVDLLNYRDQINNKINRMELTAASRVYSVAHIDDEMALLRSRSNSPIVVRLAIPHYHNQRVNHANKTVCMRWDFDPKNKYSGKWTTRMCATIETMADRTICECSLPGHFIAALLPSNRSASHLNNLQTEVNLPLVVGYSIACLYMSIVVVTYIRTYSFLVGEIHTVHLSFITSVLCYSALCLISLLYRPKSQTFVSVIRVFITYFVYVTSTTLLVEAFHMYLATFNMAKVKMSRMKLFICCWGIPVALTIPCVVVSNLVDSDDSSHAIYWLYSMTNQFYVYIITMGMEIALHLLLVSLCVFTLCKWTEDWRYAERKKYLKTLANNIVMLVLWTLTTSSAINLEARSSVGHIILHVTCILIFSVCVLLIRCILDKHIRFICGRLCCGIARRKHGVGKDQDGSSFRAYMKPEHVANVVASQEEYNVSKYYDEVDRTKYTAERKRQLSALLGSSSASTSCTKSTAVSFSTGSSNGSKESNVTSFDLGCSSGTDSGMTMLIDSNNTPSGGASGSTKEENNDLTNPNVACDIEQNMAGNLVAGQQASANGRAAPNTDDVIITDDAETDHPPRHSTRNPINLPCAQFSFIKDDPQLLTHSFIHDDTKVLSHANPESCPSIHVHPSKHSHRSPKRQRAHKLKHVPLLSNNIDEQSVCNDDQSELDICNASAGETDLAIRTKCSASALKSTLVNSDSEEDESSCSSKLL